MKLRYKSLALAALTLWLALPSQALTLGRMHGAALIGRALDAKLQLQMDAGDDAASLCLEAEVFHADVRQDASRVRVSVQPDAQARSVTVRVQSASLVDEPVVTVYLHAGCGQQITRKYVLLADVTSEAAPVETPALAVEPRPAPALPAAPSALEATTPAAVTSPRPGPPVLKQVLKKARLVATAAVAAAAAKPSTKAAVKTLPVARSAAASSSERAILSLDNLAALNSRVSALESAGPAAAAASSPVADEQKMQALQQELKTLSSLATKNSAALAKLNTRLQETESRRWPIEWLYGLGLLALLSLGGVLWLWWRQGRAQAVTEGDWARSHLVPDAQDAQAQARAARTQRMATAQDSLPQSLERETAAATRPGSVATTTHEVSELDVSESQFVNLMGSAVKKPASSAKPAKAAEVKPVATAYVPQLEQDTRPFDLVDVQSLRQQAEFLVALGQTDKAAELLKGQIADSDQPDPWVYLDLLGLLHATGFQSEFTQYRDQFNQVFQARIPEFSRFRDEGRLLEDYPDVLSQISARWPAPDVVNPYIFQPPAGGRWMPFDVAAFRELLLLHSLVSKEPPSPDFEFEPASGMPDLLLDDLTLSHGLDLDLDLDAVSTESQTISAREAGITVQGNLIDFELLPPSAGAPPRGRKPG